MPTDEERRRVAERMRASAGKYDFCASNIALDIGIVGSNYSEGYNARHRLAWLRLADLIEPGEPKVKCVAEVKIEGDKLDEAVHRAMAEYAGVDRDALLALADDIDKQTDGSMFDAWLEDGHYIARRIREACGEADG